MYFAKSFKSSPHSFPSPDGKHVATLLPSSIVVRSVASPSTVRTIKLAPDLSDGVTSFLWSPSSTRVLVAVADRLHVFSALGGNFHALVQLPQSSVTKPALITFGATDDEICAFSSVGVKLSIVSLASSKIVEIGNPKFFGTASAAKGCSFRPSTHHLALLTRTAGRDMVSIHSADTREVQRSWYPETVDAQSLAWTPDGRWLAVWDSSAHGTRVLFCTYDGHVFKDWRGFHPHPSPDDMGQYGPGVRALAFSPNGRHTAIADGSGRISILNDRLVDELLLRHTIVVEPQETLQVWQEHLDLRAGQRAAPSFVKATQAVSPPGLSTNGISDAQRGCNLAKFDSSSTLLASRLDDAPSTIWIWDIPTSELRAVLIYHGNVTKVEWHPSQPELLLMRCEGEGYGSLAFVWDPLSNGPRPIEFSRHLPSAKVTGRSDVTWLGTSTEPAALFFTDHAKYILLSLLDTDTDAGAETEVEATLSWATQATATSHDLLKGFNVSNGDPEDTSDTDMDEGTTELDDTFHFKKFPVP